MEKEGQDVDEHVGNSDDKIEVGGLLTIEL